MNERFWRSIREPFYVPAQVHQCKVADYENIDVDEAGCTLCGRVHKCGRDPCLLFEQHGYKVCEITGYCVCTTVFSDNEFVDTVAHVGDGYQPLLNGAEASVVETWVANSLLSHTASLKQEIEHNRVRRSIVLTRILKHYKVSRKSLNVVDVFTCLMNATANLREPLLLESSELHALVQYCTSMIMNFCGRFFLLKHVVPSSVKMHGFIMGVLYLARNGLCINDSVELIPAVPLLTYVLPAETQLRRLFGLSTRIMTETENIIKKSLKHLSRAQLRDIGFG